MRRTEQGLEGSARAGAGDRTWIAAAEEPGLAQTTQQVLASPELAFSLVALGLLAAMVWLATPATARAGAVGAAGAVLLLAGVAALTATRATAVAIVLLVLAAASLWFEVRYVPGLGLHAIGGWFGLTLAGVTLDGAWSGAHPAVVLPVATLTAVGTYLAGRRCWRRIDHDPLADTPLLIGRHAVVLHLHTDGRHGQAVVSGQLWAIRSRSDILRPGQRVWIVDSGRDLLTVEPDPPPTHDHNNG
jgi:membrane-bound ClpP family serine protease